MSVVTSPLAGMRVIEMGSSVAGPYAGWVFAQLGAEVIKVEDPRTGDATRTWGPRNVHGQTAIFETMNNGKKSITVDLSDAVESRALADLIVTTADVVLQNLRPGFAERCGVGQSQMTAAKPELVYCDLGAYGKGGDMAHLPGYDPLMQGFTGIAEGTGTEHSPARVVAPVTDFMTGMWAVIGALAALQGRARTAAGSAVDVSLMESGIALMTMFVSSFQSTGQRPTRRGLQGPLVSPNDGYQAEDGLIMIVCGTNSLFAKLCGAINREDLLNDPLFVDPDTRLVNASALKVELESVLQTRSRAHWMGVIGDAGVPISPVHHVDEMMQHPQAKAVGILQSLQAEPSQDGDHNFETVRLPVRFQQERAGYDTKGPTLGEHNALFTPFVERARL